VKTLSTNLSKNSFKMSEFEKTNSSEDMSPSLLPICEMIPISIKTKSSSNLIDMIDGHSSQRVSPKKKFYSMDDIFDASVRKDNPPLGVSDYNFSYSVEIGILASPLKTCRGLVPYT